MPCYFTAMSFVPDGLVSLLQGRDAPRVQPQRILKGLERTGQQPDPSFGGAFLASDENQRRYGFVLPGEVRELLRLADDWALEEVPTRGFCYYRAVAQGWHLAVDSAYLPLFHGVFAAYRGTSAFGNLQIWEHLGGLITIGSDVDDNRYFAATTKQPPPVFKMNHEAERCGLDWCVADSLGEFLEREFQAPKAGRPAGRRRRSAKHPRRTDGPLVTWPPFLLARSGWLLDAVTWGQPGAASAEASFFDLDAELPYLPANEPLTLYWLLRSFLFEDHVTFDRVIDNTDPGLSPLVASARDVLTREWTLGPAESRFTIARESLRHSGDVPREPAQLPKNLPPLV
jgi:hypothetical protein